MLSKRSVCWFKLVSRNCNVVTEHDGVRYHASLSKSRPPAKRISTVFERWRHHGPLALEGLMSGPWYPHDDQRTNKFDMMVKLEHRYE